MGLEGGESQDQGPWGGSHTGHLLNCLLSLLLSLTPIRLYQVYPALLSRGAWPYFWIQLQEPCGFGPPWRAQQGRPGVFIQCDS